MFVAFEHFWKIHKNKTALIFRDTGEEKSLLSFPYTSPAESYKMKKKEKIKHTEDTDVTQTHLLAQYL